MDTRHKGWIALDMDGTITNDLHLIPPLVVQYLSGLVSQGWKLMFITGRAFSYAYPALKAFKVPYFLAVQNGADILEMPSQRRLHQAYFGNDVVSKLEHAYQDQSEHFLVYAGYEKGDFCYYRPDRFSPHMSDYLERVKTFSSEPWQSRTHFNFAESDRFPLIKCIGTASVMDSLDQAFKTLPSVNTTTIRDPATEGLFLTLITDVGATKGEALSRILSQHSEKGPVIAAGDDWNDVSMFAKADVKIVMETAPEEIRSLASLVAPAASKEGIIPALQKVVSSWD